MKNANVEKINKLGKAGRILTKIAQICVMIGAVCTLICGIVISFIPNDSFEIKGRADADLILNIDSDLADVIDFDKKENVKIEGYDVEFDVSQNEQDGRTVFNFSASDFKKTGKELKRTGILKFAELTLYLVCTYIALLFANKLAKCFEKCETPFSDEVIETMKKFGHGLVPVGVASLISGSAGLMTALIIIFIIMLINIFSYGAELQKESDETV